MLGSVMLRAAAAAHNEPPAMTRLVRSGTTLTIGGAPWRGAGFDWHWAGLRETTIAYPTHAQVDAVLDEAVSMGATVIRAHTLGISAGRANQLVTDANADGSLVWNVAAWEPIDYVIAGAHARGLRLWIPFTDQFNYYHRGKGEWVKWAYQHQGTSNAPSSITLNGTTYSGITSFDPASGTVASSQLYKAVSQQFYRLPWIKNSWINNYVVPWFNHINQYTGVSNKDEPAVAFAQAGNELWDSGDEWPDHAGADGITWAEAFSSAVKTVAPDVLVIDPQGADGVNIDHAPGRNDANTDMLDYHLYNNHNAITGGYVTTLAAKANAFGKVAVYGEYPYARSGIDNALSEIETTSGVGFACFWAVYTSDEGHSGDGIDDTVYVVGQNSSWKTRFGIHAAIMSQGTPPPPPPPPTNLIRLANVATCEATISAYAAGSIDGADPTLSIEAGAGVGGGSALRALITGTGHKWIWADQQLAAAPVTPGQAYTASAHVQLTSGTLGSGAYGHLTWRDGDGNYMSGGTSSSITALSSSYTQVTFTSTAPAGAAYAVPQIEFDGPPSGTAVVRLDHFGVFAGSSASPWSAPQ